MNKQPYRNLSNYRKQYHLKLKDVAYLLDMDQGNLSRFETGKYQNPKAYLGYHFLFNLSIDSPIIKLFAQDNEEIIHRCFRLLEILETNSNTPKNKLRIRGVNLILKRLNNQQEDYEDSN